MKTKNQIIPKSDIKIIADNAGRATLQINFWPSGSLYQHNYDDMSQLIADALVAQNGDDGSGWDGNEAYDDDGCTWLCPTQNQIASGGYKVLSLDDIASLDDDESTSWDNVDRLRDSWKKLTQEGK